MPATNQKAVTTINASQKSTSMAPSPRPVSTDINPRSSSPGSRPIAISNIQRTPQATNTAEPAAAQSAAIVQKLSSRKRTSSDVLAPRKRRRQELLDITNSNARREGTSKRVIKASARQQAAIEGYQ